MECPICKSQLELEYVKGMGTTLFCNNGDFITDCYRRPSDAIEEVKSAYRWYEENERRVTNVDND